MAHMKGTSPALYFRQHLKTSFWAVSFIDKLFASEIALSRLKLSRNTIDLTLSPPNLERKNEGPSRYTQIGMLGFEGALTNALQCSLGNGK